MLGFDEINNVMICLVDEHFSNYVLSLLLGLRNLPKPQLWILIATGKHWLKVHSRISWSHWSIVWLLSSFKLNTKSCGLNWRINTLGMERIEFDRWLINRIDMTDGLEEIVKCGTSKDWNLSTSWPGFILDVKLWQCYICSQWRR